MNKASLSLLSCPNCGRGELGLQAYAESGTGVREGRLTCAACGNWYRIEQGIADLLPLNLRKEEKYAAFAGKHGLSYAAGRSGGTQAADKETQISFFKENLEEYEKQVVNSSFYQALDLNTFRAWVKKNLRPGDIVLDLGCGTGKQSIPLARHGVRSLGLDISEEMLLAAKEKIDAQGLSQNIDLIVGDAENPPFREAGFRACIFYGTLHHLQNKEQAIARAAGKLASHGLFYSFDPNDSPLRFVFDLMMKIWKLYDEEASDDPLISAEQLTGALNKSGIKGRIKYSTYLPPHLFYLLSLGVNRKILAVTDAIFGRIPFVNRFGGVIISEGVKVK